MLRPWLLVLLVSAMCGSIAHSRNLCTSKACISASALLHSRIDPSVNPCSDFYEFACGGFAQSQPYTASTVQAFISAQAKHKNDLFGKLFEVLFNKNLSRSDDARMNELFDGARSFFTACVNWFSPDNEWSSRPELLPRGWEMPCQESDFRSLAKPIIDFIEGFTDFEDFVARLIRSGTSDLLKLEANFQDVVGMRQRGEHWLKFKKLDFKHQNSINTVAEARRLQRIIRLSGLKVTTSPFSLAAIQKEMVKKGQFKMEGDLLFSLKAEELDPLALRIRPGLRFKWSNLMQRLSTHSGMPIKNTTKIFTKLSTFYQLTYVLHELEAQVMARNGSLYDFIRLNAVLSAFDVLSASASIPSGSSLEMQSGVCMAKVMTSMPIVLLEMFQAAYTSDTYETVEAIASEIVQSMKQSVDTESWISDVSKRAIKLKLSDIKFTIGYPRQLVQEFRAVFHGVAKRIKRSRRFGDALLAINDAKFRNDLWRLTTERPTKETLATYLDILDVNLHYIEQVKSVMIQRGYLSTIIYDKDYPDYLLYAGLGSAIGHEVAHAFDFNHHRFDTNGTFVDDSMFDSATTSWYANRTSCLLDRYNALFKSQVGVFSGNNGAGTVTENFSDIVGLNAAFRAYQASAAKSQRSGRSPRVLPGPLTSTLSPDRLFFIQAAQFYCSKAEKEVALFAFEPDVHSPPRPRVNGQMMNSKDFSKVFNCRPGDSMYLSDADKCHFW